MVKYVKYIYALITMLILWLLGAAFLDQYGVNGPKKTTYDAIVVLGCKVRSNGTASLALQRRTRAAVELYRKGYSKQIVLTGGVGQNEPSEAKAAFQYAVEHLGVRKDIFLLEERSSSTEENAKFAVEQYQHIQDVLFVSDSYHIFRAQRVFNRYFAQAEGMASKPAWNVRVYGALREVLAVVFYFLKGRL